MIQFLFYTVVTAIIIYVLIKIYIDNKRKECALKIVNSTFDRQLEMVKERDPESYSHYLGAKENGIAMISDMQMAYAMVCGLLQNEGYYCRYTTLTDAPYEKKYSLWKGDKLVMTTLYAHLMEDLVRNNVIITKEEMNEMLQLKEISKTFEKTEGMIKNMSENKIEQDNRKES